MSTGIAKSGSPKIESGQNLFIYIGNMGKCQGKMTFFAIIFAKIEREGKRFTKQPRKAGAGVADGLRFHASRGRSGRFAAGEQGYIRRPAGRPHRGGPCPPWRRRKVRYAPFLPCGKNFAALPCSSFSSGKRFAGLPLDVRLLTCPAGRPRRGGPCLP